MKHIHTFEDFVNENESLNEGEAVHRTFNTENFKKEVEATADANRQDFKRFIQGVLTKASRWTSLHKLRLTKDSLAWLGEIYAKRNGKDNDEVQADIKANMDTYKKIKIYG
jgi:hypothetical protein